MIVGSEEPKGAEIYRHRDKLYFRSQSRSTDEVWIAAAEFEALSVEADVATVGEALVRALSASRVGVPHPRDFSDDGTGPMLQAAGVKHWTLFAKVAKCVGARVHRGTLTLTPDRYIGRGAFVEIVNAKVVLGLPSSSETVGGALLSAFERCE